jgi:hypothetical protein
VSKYIPIPKSDQKKRGPKSNMGTLGEKARARISHLNIPPNKSAINKHKTDLSRDFYSKAQEILNGQMGKLYQKSIRSNLDQYQIKALMEMVRTSIVLDSKTIDLPQEENPELLEQALNMLKARADNKTDEPTKETDEPIPENLTPTTEE